MIIGREKGRGMEQLSDILTKKLRSQLGPSEGEVKLRADLSLADSQIQALQAQVLQARKEVELVRRSARYHSDHGDPSVPKSPDDAFLEFLRVLVKVNCRSITDKTRSPYVRRQYTVAVHEELSDYIRNAPQAETREMMASYVGKCVARLITEEHPTHTSIPEWMTTSIPMPRCPDQLSSMMTEIGTPPEWASAGTVKKHGPGIL
jgi:hypothetical protein